MILSGSGERTGSSNLKKDGVSFVKAVVSSGTWIFYTYPNNNDAQYGAGPSNYKVVKPGPDVKISSVNGSMLLLPDQVEGVILFEHSFYGGSNKVRKIHKLSIISSSRSL